MADLTFNTAGNQGEHLNMPIDVTFGGKRQTGTVSRNEETGAVTFSAA